MKKSHNKALSLALVLSALWMVPTYAHKSPVTCSGSGLGIALYSDVKKVHIGDTISYSIDIFDGLASGPTVCDATEIEASITTPDGVNHPISLWRRISSHGVLDSYVNVVTYVARAEDVQSDSTLRATAMDAGNIHQNDTDSRGGGHQSLNVEVIVVEESPSLSPSPTESSGGSSGSRSRRVSSPAPTPSEAPVIEPVIPIVSIFPILPKTGFPPRDVGYKISLWNYVFNLFF